MPDEPRRRTIGGYGSIEPSPPDEGRQKPSREGFDLSEDHGRQYLRVVADPARTDVDRTRAALRLGMFPALVDEVLALACDPTVPAEPAHHLGRAAVQLLAHRADVDETTVAAFAPAARAGAQSAIDLRREVREGKGLLGFLRDPSS